MVNHERVSDKNTLPPQIEALSHIEKLKQYIEQLEKNGKNLEKEQVKELELARVEIKKLELEQQQQIEQLTKQSPYSMSEQKQSAYKQIMREVKLKLPNNINRSFSNLIHQPVIEKVSEIAEKTVMRSSLLLGGSIGALVGGGLLYILAKRYGFPLSGSEMLIFGLVGAIFGLVIELVKNLLTKRR